ncbi:hypothetical protein D3C78_1873220 [compost metagenome]
MTRINHHFHFRFDCVFIGETVVGHGPFHHTQLTKNTGGGVVMAQQRSRYAVFSEKRG